MGTIHRHLSWRLKVFLACIMTASLLACGCSHLNDGYQATSTFEEANDFFSRGDYLASLGKYQQIIEHYPTVGDRALFEMGIIHAYAGNEHKDYLQSLQCFRKLIKDYPESSYRKDSESMIFTINNVMLKDQTIAEQQMRINTLQREITGNGNEMSTLHEKITALEQEVRNKEHEIGKLHTEVFVLQKGTVDRILIEKKARILTLFSKGKMLKMYRIALGGNPNGPKERQGDNKTPEGTYVIDAKNRDSRYHRSLHISYPNGNDKKRAQQLGVSPGGDIMIHGIKNGFSSVGDLHTRIDWTKGCIAVTDEEIEEIDALTPKGTIVDIRP